MPWPTPEEGRGALCYCGRYGCLETYLSGAGLARAYAELGGGAAAAAEIAGRFEAGEALADAAINRYADRLARGLAGVINVRDREVIILGGGLSNIGALL